MELSTYIKSLSKDELKSFADRCETSPQHLQQIYRGNRRAGENLAINIERESNQAILCEQLRPDVDWAYLRSTNPVKVA